MTLWDIACIVFACTAANHLGLIQAVQTAVECNQLPIVSCVKCFSFWAVMVYCLVVGVGIINTLAISFLCAWLAIWLDLFMGIIDYLYLKIYEQIYPTTDETDADPFDTEDTLSDVRNGREYCCVTANENQNENDNDN